MSVLRRRGGLWMAAAALAAALAALLAIRAAAGDPPEEAVWVARVPIPTGTLLDRDDGGLLVAVPVPAGLPLAGLIRSRAALEGRRTVAPLEPGEPLTLAAVGGGPGAGPEPLRPGERAISVPLATAGSAAASLRPGLRVDAVASSGDGAAGRSEVVVSGAEVLAVDDGGAPDSQLLSGAVIVRVSEDDALRLTEALNFAREVRLWIRPFGEPRDG